MLESLRIPEKLFSVAAWALSLCGPLATAMRVEGTEDFYHVRAFAAESTVHIVSGKWYDGSWWEIDIPEPWSVTETSNQHIRFTNAGAKVLIGFRHHHRVHEASKRDA